ncbi:MAG: alanine racemase [Candidatus Midichloriaceae bacterium]|jgi:alanine racemase
MYISESSKHQYVSVNLKNIGENYKKIRSVLKSSICSAVVKADAYGLGVTQVSKHLYTVGCKDFWVSNLEEASKIRNCIKESNIYVFQGVNSEEEVKYILEYSITPVISEMRQLEIINKFASQKIDIILNFDTGMGRDGFQLEEVEKLDLKGINIKYIMSHLSCADNKEHFLNTKQLEEVNILTIFFPNKKITFANSSGIFLDEDYHFDMVRPGGALYGVNPLQNSNNPMLNVVEFMGSVLNHKIFLKDQWVGYNATYKVKKNDKVLILNVGYYDGYKRILSNASKVYAAGYYLPIIGMVSMNMIAVDANLLPEALFFSINCVELIGEHITIESMGELAKTDPREILTSLPKDCKRIYIE